jgi:hypothetical protein
MFKLDRSRLNNGINFIYFESPHFHGFKPCKNHVTFHILANKIDTRIL